MAISIDDCIASALKYKRRGDWAKAEPRYYQCAYRRKWLPRCSAHMDKPIIGKKRTISDCKLSAQNYETRMAWLKGDRKSCEYAQGKGWLDECCVSHMKSRCRLTPEQVELRNEINSKGVFDDFNMLMALKK